MDSRPPRFDRTLFTGRCRRHLLIGLFGLLVAAGYGTWAAEQFSRRDAEATAFDQPIVRAARLMVPPPAHLRSITPVNSRELYLVTVVSDQQDVMVGLAVLVLRSIVTLTVGGIAMVLLTAGATEWEVMSRRRRA